MKDLLLFMIVCFGVIYFVRCIFKTIDDYAFDPYSDLGDIYREHLALGKKVAKTKNINELLQISSKIQDFKDKWNTAEADNYAKTLKRMADNKGLKLTLTANLRSGVRRSGG